MSEALLSTYGTLIVGGLTLLSVMAIVVSLRPRRSPITERLQAHAGLTDLADEELTRSFWDRAVLPALRAVVGVLGRLSPKGNVEGQRHLILLAGNPGGLTVVDLLGLKLLLAGLTFGLALLYVRNIGDLSLRSMVMLVVAPVLGYYLPGFFIKRRIKQRQHDIERALPDVLDMLTICVESGLGLEAAMLRVGEQWDNVLTREMGRAVREMRMGISRGEALRHMVQRTEASDLAAFVAVVVQAEQLGVSIANVLRTQSDQMRVVRWQRAEEKARGAPFKMVFAMVFLIFPSLFIVILGPSIPRFQEFIQGMTR